MFNHHRGLWGYSGPAADGSGMLMVQGTGIGGPSLNAVVSDLALLGVERMLRLGTAASPALELGSVVIATEAYSDLGPASVRADSNLDASATALLQGAAHGAVLSSRVHLTPTSDAIPEPAVAADLSTASLYDAAERLGFAALSLLLITETGAGITSDGDLEAALKAIAPKALALIS
jgi:purine-nucleoside phosphorylase